MRFNHLTLSVTDVPANRAFFETYFGLRCVVDRGEALALLTDEAGFVLSLIHFPKVPVLDYPDHPESFHVGFLQDSPDRVDEIHARLVAGGVAADPPRRYHGAWTFYFRAPGGFQVEVGHQSFPD